MTSRIESLVFTPVEDREGVAYGYMTLVVDDDAPPAGLSEFQIVDGAPDGLIAEGAAQAVVRALKDQ